MQAAKQVEVGASATSGLTPRLRRFEDLPGPSGIPIFGNALQIKTERIHLQLEKWCQEFGPFFKLKLGKRQIIVVGDHSVVATMLRDRPDGFRRTTRLNEIWAEMGLPNGVFGASGDVWKAQRRMVMAAFDPAHVRHYFPALQRVSERLAGRWHKAAQTSKDIDLQLDLMRFTVDTIAGLAFGADVNTLESDQDVIQQHLDKIFPAVFGRIFAPFPIWRYRKSSADKALAISVTAINSAIEGFIADARQRLKADPALRDNPSNLLEAMLVAADEPASGIDDRQVAGNVLTMLLAGEDTTANTIAWMIHLLWRNPQTLARAVAEVREVCGDARHPTLEQMARLDYIEACAHETMRLKPVAPQLPLQALRDTSLGDVQVKTGQVVFGLMRRDSVSETHVPNASVFDPDRWLVSGSASAAAQSAKRVSMPFGAGPRICPGRYLALLEMKMAMATLLGRFDIKAIDTPDGNEAAERLSFTMTPVGLTMRVIERVGVTGNA